MKTLEKRLGWGIIAAAFIGPGTVTTASLAGASSGWALAAVIVFSVGACWLLQEGAARLGAGSGQDFSAIIRHMEGKPASVLAALALLIGNGAFQGGNILGAAMGLHLLTGLPVTPCIALTGIGAGLLLLSGKEPLLTRALTALVAVMGIGFIAVATGKLASGAWTGPQAAPDPLLAAGLLGTTVVPYNLFLGTRMARGQTFSDFRIGLAGSVGMGGLITLAIFIAAMGMPSGFTLERLAAFLTQTAGTWGGKAFALGLFAAGFTSAITAPWAARVAVDGLQLFRSAPQLAWALVWAVGLGLALAGGAPATTIVAAQAINGVLLPFLALLLWKALNTYTGLPGVWRNSGMANGLMGLAVAVAAFLGFLAVWRAASLPAAYAWAAAGGAACIVTGLAAWRFGVFGRR